MIAKLVCPILLIAAQACSLLAQTIVVPELTPIGEPIIAKVEGLASKSRITWKADAGASVINAGNGRAYLWGTVGTHSVQAVVAPSEGDLIWLEAKYAVGDAPPPSPTPTPVPKTLKDLAGKDSVALAAVYADLLAAVNAGEIASVEFFNDVHAIHLERKGLTKNGAAAAIEKRLKAQTLDQLKASLAGIVKDLGAEPIPPPPDPPSPPSPVDDPWKVGEAAFAILSALSPEVKAQAAQTAALYVKAADGLEDGTYPSVSGAAKWLQAERKKLWGSNAPQWVPMEAAVNDIWNQHWPMLKGDVARFYRAVAAGIGRVN